MERIRELRLKIGLTQKELAERLGVDRTSVVKYETGRNGPTTDVLNKLATIFGVSVDYLLRREDAEIKKARPHF